MSILAHLRRLAVVTTVASATLITGVGGAARAAEPSSWSSFTEVVGQASFVRIGVVQGQPGNAHSGVLGFDSAEDPLGITLMDWSCPAGVRPPTYDISGTTCTLLRYRVAITGDYGTSNVVLRGPLDASYRGVGSFHYYVDGAWTERQDQLGVDVRWRQTGPLKRTVERFTTNGLRSVQVTLVAPMRLAGHVGWVDFSDPRNNATVDYYQRFSEYDEN